jgi:hypothetical protein
VLHSSTRRYLARKNGILLFKYLTLFLLSTAFIETRLAHYSFAFSLATLLILINSFLIILIYGKGFAHRIFDIIALLFLSTELIITFSHTILFLSILLGTLVFWYLLTGYLLIFVLPVPGSGKETQKTTEISRGFLKTDIPKEMPVRKWSKVQVALAKQKELLENISSEDVDNVSEVETSKFMQMQLQGNAFDVKCIGSEEQEMRGEQANVWMWEVRPKRPGSLGLNLVILIRMYYGERKEVIQSIIPYKIKVSKTKFYNLQVFWVNHWQWILSFLFGSGIVINLIDHFIKK